MKSNRDLRIFQASVLIAVAIAIYTIIAYPHWYSDFFCSQSIAGDLTTYVFVHVLLMGLTQGVFYVVIKAIVKAWCKVKKFTNKIVVR